MILVMSACTPAVPLGITWAGEPSKEEEIKRGVVNGLWQHDPARNSTRLRGSFGKADENQAAAFAARHLVRVGINHSCFISKHLELVALPEGWTHSLSKVVDDDRTINIGDVVDARTIVGTNITEVVAIVRKCDEPAVAGEKKEWSIGCKQVEGFDTHGYGGEKYYMCSF